MNDREQECLYSIALSLVPHIGTRGAKRLYDAVGSATDIFRYRKELHERVPDLHPDVCRWLDCPEALSRAEEEMRYITDHHIRFYLYGEPDYPMRFRDCDDSSVVLFSKGDFDMNVRHVIGIVGTRHATDYGRQFCSSFIRDLATLCPDVLIVSGLAYGIDITAHRAALDNGLSTIGVLGHGLDRLYPAAHRHTAINMLKKGGLLTEFISGTSPDRFNFVSRNRIIAGLSDAVIVIESAAKGGSLITADIAESYHRDCFAVPGKIGEEYSVGCNRLIHDNRAALLFDAEDFVKAMQWQSEEQSSPKAIQRDLFPSLSDEQKAVVQLLNERGSLHINTLVIETGIPVNKMNALLFDLEMQGVIQSMAGGVYQMLKF
jgi:DNA processing protein